MQIDHAEQHHIKVCREAFEELKQSLLVQSTFDKAKSILALQHIGYLETKIEKQEKRLEEYHNFFKTLQSLLPRIPSVHDLIG